MVYLNSIKQVNFQTRIKLSNNLYGLSNRGFGPDKLLLLNSKLSFQKYSPYPRKLYSYDITQNYLDSVTIQDSSYFFRSAIFKNYIFSKSQNGIHKIDLTNLNATSLICNFKQYNLSVDSNQIIIFKDKLFFSAGIKINNIVVQNNIYHLDLNQILMTTDLAHQNQWEMSYGSNNRVNTEIKKS